MDIGYAVATVHAINDNARLILVVVFIFIIVIIATVV